MDGGLCLDRQMVPLESDMFVDGVGSDGEGEEFNSEGCRWEEEEAEEEEKQVVVAKPPPVAAAIPEKVLFFPNVLQILYPLRMTHFCLKCSCFV